jgi:hypothetical protein
MLIKGSGSVQNYYRTIRIQDPKNIWILRIRGTLYGTGWFLIFNVFDRLGIHSRFIQVFYGEAHCKKIY